MISTPEKTKDEISEEINTLLGTSIDFAKLTKDDLVMLQGALAKFNQSAEFSMPLLDKPIGDILDKRIFNKTVRETTLRDLFGLPKEGKGIFGFGILGNLRRRPEKEVEEKKTEPTS